MERSKFLHLLRCDLKQTVIFNIEHTSNRMPRTIIPTNYDGDPADHSLYNVDSFQEFNALRNLFLRIESTIKYGEDKNKFISNPDIGYTLESCPTNSSIKYVNSNTNTIAQFADEILSKVKTNKKKLRIFITGKVGVGKSTFLAYFRETYKAQIKTIGASFATFNYQDYEFENNNKSTEELTNKISYEILYKTCISLLADNCSKKFLENFNSTCGDLHRTKRIEESTYNQLKTMSDIIYEYFQDEQELSLPDFEDACRGLNYESLSFLLKHYCKKNHRFVVIFDGLDRLSPDSWYTSEYNKYVNAVHQIVFKSRYLKDCAGVLFHYILVVRNCSYKVFQASNILEDLKEFKPYIIEPKSVHSIVKNAVNCVLMDNYDTYPLHVRNNLETLFQSLLHSGAKALNLDNPEKLAGLFEYNYRKLLRFLYDIALHTSYNNHNTLISKYKETDTKRFAQFLSRFGLRDKNIKSYKITELFIFSNKYMFSNYYQVDKVGCDFKTNPQDADRGYIDNIFNYTFSTSSSKVPFLIEKLRILQACNDYTPSCDIFDLLEKIGYQLTLGEVDFTLRLMLNSGLLKVRAKSEKSVLYKRTNLGEYLVNRFAYNYTYIAHTTMTTYFPTCIAKHIKRHYQEMNTYEFVRQNIINVYLFLLYLNHVEHKEKSYATTHESRTFLDNNAIYLSAKKNYLNSIRKILYQRIGDRWIDHKEIYDLITSIRKTWQDESEISLI